MSRALHLPRERVRSPLARPEFRRVWLGLTVSRVGDQLTSVALLWLVLQVTGSGVALGLVVLCFQLPAFLSSPLLGAGFDRLQPRLLMAVDNFGRACLMAMIPALYLLGTMHLWMVYGLALAAGVLSPATSIGLNLVIPRIVSDAELERANALAAMSWDFSTLIGPAIAGFLILFIGAPLVLIFDALTFLLMGVMVLTIPQLPRTSQGQARGGRRFRNLLGFGILFRLRPVLLLSLLTLLFLFSQGLAEIALPVYSQKTLGAGSVGYGLLLTANSVGLLIALAVSQRWTQRFRPGTTLALILLFSGLTLTPLLIVRQLVPAALVMGLAGLSSGPYYVAEQSITQRLVPEQVRGQIFGARGAMNVAGYPLGGMLGGALLTALGPQADFGAGAVLCLALAALCVGSPLIRGLRRSQKPSSAAA